MKATMVLSSAETKALDEVIETWVKEHFTRVDVKVVALSKQASGPYTIEINNIA